jgi:hypothetical protein
VCLWIAVIARDRRHRRDRKNRTKSRPYSPGGLRPPAVGAQLNKNQKIRYLQPPNRWLFYFWEETVTKEEVTNSILFCVKKLRHVPSRAELLKLKGVTRGDLRRHFGTYQCALEACGLEGRGGGRKVKIEQLFKDWAEIVRKLKKAPTLIEYERLSQYSVRPLLRTFRAWANIPDGMKLYVEEQSVGEQSVKEQNLAEEYKDVLEVIERRASSKSNTARMPVPPQAPKIMTDRPVYGPLLQGCPLVFAPTCEAGVLYLFGALSERLGFLALRIQTGYPDCEAMRVVAENRLQRLRIEIEYQSRNFLKHMHEPTGCDLIVCWEHNWPECPVEVLELRKFVEVADHRVIG